MNEETQTSRELKTFASGGKVSNSNNKWEALAEKLRLRITDEIKEEPVIMQFEDEYGSIPVFKLGDFSTLIGKPKVGKSNAIVLFAGTVLANKTINVLTANMPPGKEKIIYFDTEQSKSDCQNILRKIYRYAGISPKHDNENIIYFPLRPLSPKERLSFMDYFINQTKNLGFVVIDGIRDVVASINDEKEATAATQYLMKWTEQKQIHILTVLHENKINSEARGHLGSELINKSETVISMEKNEHDIRFISAKFTRNKPFRKYAILLDENEMPYIDESIEIDNDNPKRQAPKAVEFDLTLLKDIAKEVFSSKPGYKYGEAWNLIKEATKNYFPNPIGDNKAKEVLKEMQNKSILTYDENSKQYFHNGQFGFKSPV